MRTGRKDHTGPAAVLLLLLAVAGCYGDGTLPPDEQVATRLVIEPDLFTFTYIGETKLFGAKVFDQMNDRMPQARVFWSTADTSFFYVSGGPLGGTVTALANGGGRLVAVSGEVTTSATVVVRQSADTVRLLSGDGQEGIRGEPLPEPVTLYLVDPGGTPAGGVAVRFTPHERSGAVGDSIVYSGTDGFASTMWTLGDRRLQSLTVSAGDYEEVLTAVAFADPPIPDYALVGDPEPTRFDPIDTDTVEIRVPVANLGDGAGPATFPARLTVDGVAQRVVHTARIAPGDTGTVILHAGPLEAGTRRIGVEINPGGRVEEWETGNNIDSLTLNVLRQQEISVGQVVTLESNEANEEFLFRVEIAEDSDEALNVELAGGSGDADLFAHYGVRPNFRYRYRCFGVGEDTDEECQMVPARAGTYHFAVHAFTTFGPSTLTVTLGGKPVEPFDIELVFLEGGTDAQRETVEDAAETWENAISRDVFDWDHDAFDPVPAGTCGPGSPAVSDVVDDIRIFVTIDSIDGVGGVMAQSGPCWVRPFPLEGGEGIWLQPTLAALILDEDDVADLEDDDELLESFFTHEMAHALGFVPGLWDRHDRLRDPSLPGDPGADPHFDGPMAIAAFDAAGGEGYAHAKVPLESGARAGISDSNWRESVFGDELMTPFLTGDSQPLSLITLGSFHDIGYEVNPRAADPYSLPGGGRPAPEMRGGRVLDLRHDVAAIPIRVLRLNPRRVK